MKEKIVFFGSGAFVVPVAEILNSNFNLTLIVTTESQTNGPVTSFARKNNIGLLSARGKINEVLIKRIKKAGAKIAVLAHFGKIVPQALLDAFPMGIINVHPSLLPAYRGPTPGQMAILAGEKTTGVSLIRLDERVDHGPVLAQKPEEILPDDTAITLYTRLFKIAADLLLTILPKYLTGKLQVREQNHNKATFTKQLTKQDGFIDLENPPAPAALDRRIRAYYPWPGTWIKFRIQNSEFKIIKLLPNQKIQIEGKREMSYKDFINGYQQKAIEFLQKLGLT